MLELAGIVLLVALILVGALMPLKYTAQMKLPGRPREGLPETTSPEPGDERHGERGGAGRATEVRARGEPSRRSRRSSRPAP